MERKMKLMQQWDIVTESNGEFRRLRDTLLKWQPNIPRRCRHFYSRDQFLPGFTSIPASFFKQREKGEQEERFYIQGITKWDNLGSFFFSLLQLSGFKDFLFFALKWHRYFSLLKKCHDVHITYLGKKMTIESSIFFICLILASTFPLSIFQTAGRPT